MKFLKNNLKLVIGLIIGAILASGITVYAYSYASKDVSYIKPGTDTAISVEAALNDLYTKTNSNSDINYEIIYQKKLDASNYGTYNYTITANDTKFKSLIIIADSVNVSVSVSPANVNITNGNISAIYNESEISYKEYSNYNLTNDLYVGKINNPQENDSITVN